jgi:uncharacterized membrane protein YeaQ/YmgE (transglycosylase-associated protein family)
MKPELQPKVQHRIYEIVGFQFVGPYTLEIEFNDGITRKIDFEAVLEGELYGPLKNPSVFQGVKLDRERGNLVWPNSADFDQEILHDWPERKSAMVAAAARWRRYSRGFGRVREDLLHILWSAVVGLVTGYVVKLFMHTHLELSKTMLVGFCGAMLGGLVARLVSLRWETVARHKRIYSTAAAVVGAVLVPVLLIVILAGGGS